jgi:ComF family protein
VKFAQDLATAHLLGELLAGKIPADSRKRPAIVLPVPLHRKRLSERGYNQALEIARSLSEKGYRLDPTCCRRHKATSAQSDLPAGARKGNVRNAFSVSRLMKESRVLLIDDVMTTGATLNELARTLKKAGAERVEAWVIARTGQKNGDRF